MGKYAIRGDLDVRGNWADELMALQGALKTGLGALKEQLSYLAAEADRFSSEVTIYADLRPTVHPIDDLAKVMAADKRDLTAVAENQRGASAAEREPEREKAEKAFEELEKQRYAYRGMQR